jgi:hypothetical protein
MQTIRNNANTIFLVMMTEPKIIFTALDKTGDFLI